MLSDYMGDKQLSNVQFDTLQNHMNITRGESVLECERATKTQEL